MSDINRHFASRTDAGAAGSAPAPNHTPASRTTHQLRERVRFFDTVSDGILILDLDGIIVDCNAGAERIFGCSRDELLGSDVETLHDPSLGGTLEREIRTSLSASGRWAGEIPMPRSDGVLLTVDVVVTFIHDEHGERIGILGVNRDVTERRATQLALRESEAELRALIGAIADVILVIGRDGRYLKIAPTATSKLLRPADELLGRTFHEVLPRELADEFLEAVHTALDTRAPVSIEYTVPIGARTVSFEAAVSPMYNDRVVWVARDVSSRRRLEEQLRHAQKMEAVGRLAGGVAHDFNNLLTAMLSNVDLALDGLAPDADVRVELEQIRGAAERAAGLTRQLLTFGRRQVLRTERLDLNLVIRECEQMLRRLLDDRTSLVLNLLDASLPVRADRGQLEQVLSNIVLNAREAMPDGGVVTISTRLDALTGDRPHGLLTTPGTFAVLSVTDTGVGMDEETRRQVFEPFFTTKEQGKGTGLGLATAYGIVEQVGGDIHVSSVPGSGTTFEIFLPSTGTPSASAPVVVRHAVEARGRETVLVVEDEPAVRGIVRRLLERSGYTVLEAVDGVEALRLFAQRAGGISLVLTDVMMPGLTGPELASLLRRRHRGLRVIYMSGYDKTGVTSTSAIGEGDSFIGKPFTTESLLRSVREALDRKV